MMKQTKETIREIIESKTISKETLKAHLRPLIEEVYEDIRMEKAISDMLLDNVDVFLPSNRAMQVGIPKEYGEIGFIFGRKIIVRR